MPEAAINTPSGASIASQPDWEELKERLGASSVEETQRRAYEIAKFVADVENDKESELILKTGSRNLALKLNKASGSL